MEVTQLDRLYHEIHWNGLKTLYDLSVYNATITASKISVFTLLYLCKAVSYHLNGLPS